MSVLRNALTGLITIATMALAAACGSSDTGSGAAPGPPPELRLGYFANVTHAAAIIGVDRGLFAKELGATKLATSTRRTSGRIQRSTPSGEATARPSGSSPERRPVARSWSSAPASTLPRICGARRWPARNSAIPKTSRCVPGWPRRACATACRVAGTSPSPPPRTPTRSS